MTLPTDRHSRPAADLTPDFAGADAPSEDRWPTLDAAAIRQALQDGQEIALLDVREEDPYAQGHPLWAANLPLSTLERHVWRRLPRRDVQLVLYGSQVGSQGPDGPAQDLAPLAAARLRALGYSNIHLLAGGLDGWRRAGGELFIDVNVPSKAFGELVEATRHTPSLTAPEVKALLDARADVVVVDARRFEEYRTMSIPGGTSVPGAELVLRVRELAPNPATQVVVNCAGRTRSIIGTQSLLNAGLPNPVAALRNGTIGWLLAGQTLDHGASRRHPVQVGAAPLRQAQADARAVADRAGVRRVRWPDLATLADARRTLYRYDVRTPEEFEAGHLPGFGSAPGGQLVQETDHNAPVRGARIVLADDDGVRANMSASWLAQMGWEVYVVDDAPPEAFAVHGPWQPPQPDPPAVAALTPAALAELLQQPGADVALLDIGSSAHYVERHIPGAWHVNRALLDTALARIGSGHRHYVLIDDGSTLAHWATRDLSAALAAPGAVAEVRVLIGGTPAWVAQGLPLEHGESRLATPRIDRYRRPYEGTTASAAAMQAYLDWEFGLVAQLERDGSHGFRVL